MTDSTAIRISLVEGEPLKKHIVGIAFLLSVILTIPATLLDLLFLFNGVNPMTLMFVTSFQLRNESSEELRVWVAGTDERGELALLPLLASRIPALPALRSDFRLAPGATRTVTYDWDDTNFTLILVETPSGELRAVPVDAEDRQEGCCWRHFQQLYGVPPSHELRSATAEERELVRGGGSDWLWLAPCLIMPWASLYLYRVRRRLRAQAA
jgi:hypothetical protein